MKSLHVEVPYDSITIGRPPLLYVPSPARNLSSSPALGAGTNPPVPAADDVAPVIAEGSADTVATWLPPLESALHPTYKLPFSRSLPLQSNVRAFDLVFASVPLPMISA